MRPTPFRALPSPFKAYDYLARARLFRAVALEQVDMHGPEPNWPKYFLLGHAVELARQAVPLAFDDLVDELLSDVTKLILPTGIVRLDHDLLARSREAFDS